MTGLRGLQVQDFVSGRRDCVREALELKTSVLGTRVTGLGSMIGNRENCFLKLFKTLTTTLRTPPLTPQSQKKEYYSSIAVIYIICRKRDRRRNPLRALVSVCRL